METETPQLPLSGWDFWREGLDRTFLVKVYRWSAIIGAVATLGSLGLEKREWAMGIVFGVLVGMFSLWTVEMTVKLLFRGGGFAGFKLLIAALFKLPLLLGGLMFVAWASQNGVMSIWAALCGMLIVHGTLVIRGLSTAVSQLDKDSQRY